ncbi:transposase, partial [Klebsiella pneumoniae]|uniref:transposase n=1 Tax=Klebsiella pneumoniae TaxID=573 RepID=UPI001D0EEAAC
VPAYGPQNDVTLKMPAFEWVHVQLHQQKGMISLSPPTICNSADKTRQNEHPHLPVESRHQAKGTRFLWQYSDKWMTESRQEKLMWLRAQMKLTSQCWALKELAKDIWNRPWSEERRSDWQRWLALAANSDVPMMKNAAKTIGKRLYGILNAMRHSVSNGNAEALNSKIRLLRIKARGYRNRERFKLGVMFHYGKLNMAF